MFVARGISRVHAGYENSEAYRARTHVRIGSGIGAHATVRRYDRWRSPAETLIIFRDQQLRLTVERRGQTLVKSKFVAKDYLGCSWKGWREIEPLAHQLCYATMSVRSAPYPDTLAVIAAFDPDLDALTGTDPENGWISSILHLESFRDQPNRNGICV